MEPTRDDAEMMQSLSQAKGTLQSLSQAGGQHKVYPRLEDNIESVLDGQRATQVDSGLVSEFRKVTKRGEMTYLGTEIKCDLETSTTTPLPMTT